MLDIPDNFFFLFFFFWGGGGGGGVNGRCWSKPTYEEKMRVPSWGYICTYIRFVVLTFIFGIFTSSFVFYLLCLNFCLQKDFFPLLSFAFCVLTFGFLLLSFVFKLLYIVFWLWVFAYYFYDKKASQ